MSSALQSVDVFTSIVPTIVKTAKQTGATAETLSAAFMRAMVDNFGDADLKNSAAVVGFIELLNAEGGSVSAKDATKLYSPTGCSEEAVRKAARQRSLIAIRDGTGSLHFPVWQFSPRGGALPGVSEVLQLLSRRPHIDDVSIATFFTNPSARLGNRSPIAALRSGDEKLIAAVKRLAAEASE